jgi:hypothetical protein
MIASYSSTSLIYDTNIVILNYPMLSVISAIGVESQNYNSVPKFYIESPGCGYTVTYFFELSQITLSDYHQ